MRTFALLFLAVTLNAQSFPETPVADVAYAHNFERVVGAASDGENFLVLGMRGSDLYAHRVTASGEVLDGTGIRLVHSEDAYSLGVLGVFWTGDAYTIVIRAQRQNAFDLVIARLGADGMVLDAPHVVFSGDFFSGAASNRARIVVAGRTLTVLDERGNLLERGIEPPVDPTAANNWDFHVASNGSGFMLSWTSFTPTSTSNVVNFAPLDASGHPTRTRRSLPGPGTHVLASNGHDYLAVYRDTTFRTLSQHVSETGDLLESQPLTVPMVEDRSMIWNGEAYVLVAQTTQGLPTALRLSPSGSPVDPGVVTVNAVDSLNSGTPLPVAVSGRQTLIAFPEGKDPRWFGALLGRDLKLAAKFAIGVTATIQFAPSVATNGQNILVVWEEDATIYTSRLTLTGQRLDGRGIKLSTAAAHNPRVIWDGENYVVGWVAGDVSPAGVPPFISIAHLSPDGVVLPNPETPAFAALCGVDFALAPAGDAALLVAMDCTTGRLMAARVRREGMTAPPVPVSPAMMYATTPRAAFNGSEFLVTFAENLPDLAGHYRANLRAVRLSSSLTVLDTDPLRIAVSPDGQDALAQVASNGHDFLVAWTHALEIRARSVSADGALGDVVDVDNGIVTSVVFDGRSYTLAFTRSSDVLLHRIGAAAAAPISATADAESEASLAPLGNGAVVAVYTRAAPEPQYGGSLRVFARGLTPLPPRARAVR